MRRGGEKRGGGKSYSRRRGGGKDGGKGEEEEDNREEGSLTVGQGGRRGIERRKVLHLADGRRRVRGPEEIGMRGTANKNNTR